MPLRHLMTLYADAAGSDAAGVVANIDAALGFAQQVVDSGALYFKANPAVGGNPVPLPVGTTMIEGLCSTLHYCRRYWITTRKESDDSAHADMHPLNSISDIDVPGFGAEGEPYVPRL